MDQVRVVGLWGFGARPIWGLANTGTGRNGWAETGWAEMGRDETGRADVGKMPATQSRKFENKSNKMRI